MRLGDALPRQPQRYTLPRCLACPYAVRAAASPFLTRGIFATAPGGVAHDDLQIALLRGEPALDEGNGIGSHAGEEGMLGFRPTDSAHEKRDLFVDGLDLLQRLGALLGADDAVEKRLEGVVEGDLNIVDGRLRRLLAGFRGRCDVVLVYTDRVLQLDGREGGKVGFDELREAGEVERVCTVEEGLELGVAGELALVVVLLQVLRPGIFPDAHENASAILLVGVQELGHGLAQTEDLGVLVALQIDGDVDVLVALALELDLAEGVVLRLGALGPLPLDLGEVVGLQALGAVEVDGDGGEELREGLRLGVGVGLGVVVHGVRVLVVVLILVLQALVAALVEQAALDSDAVGGIGVALEVEGVGVHLGVLPGLVLGGVGEPDAHGGGAAAAGVEDGVGGLELFAHHGRVQGALDVAQLAVAGHAVADANIVDALGHVPVGGVLGLAPQLVAALHLGVLGLLELGIVVVRRRLLLLRRRVLVRVGYGGWFAEHVLQVSLPDHGGQRGAAGAGQRTVNSSVRQVGAGGRYVPGPRRVGGAWCAAWAASG